MGGVTHAYTYRYFEIMILAGLKSDGQKVKLRNSIGRFRGQFLDRFCDTFLENVAQTDHLICVRFSPR